MHDVFDSSGTIPLNFFTRTVNFLHVNTRTSIVSRELLFLSDSVITAQRINETANNLRALGIFHWVRLDVNPSNGNTGNVDVSVKDQFSTEIGMSLLREAGDLKGSVRFRESNLLGRGYLFGVSSSNKGMRTTKEVRFTNSRLFSSRFVQKLQYTQLEKGRNIFAVLDREFFSLETGWDAALEYSDFDGEQNLYNRGEVASKYNHFRRKIMAEYGFYSGKSTRLRLGVRYSHNDERWGKSPDSAGETRRNSRMFSLWIGGIRRKIDVINNIDLVGLDEDVHTGMLFNIGAGTNVKAFGGGQPARFLSVRSIFSRSLSGSENIFFEITHNSRQIGSHPVERITSSRVIFYSIRFPYQTFAARIEYINMKTPRPFERFYLGESDGIRGFGVQSFSGTKRFSINFEDRISPEIGLWIVRFGFVLFCDAGKIWDAAGDFRSIDWHASAGFGLRISMPRITMSIVRFDLAYNLDDSEFSSVSFSSGHFFRVLYPIQIGIPNLKLPSAF